MPDELPVACSLSAAEFPARLAQVAALGRDALVDAHVTGARARLRFALDPRVRERVEAFAEAERRCCPFLRFTVTDAPDAVLLVIDAPDDAAGVLAELVAALDAERRPGAGASPSG
jgi:hypothetical protein